MNRKAIIASSVALCLCLAAFCAYLKMQSVRQRQLRTSCISNLSQHGKGMNMFSMDHSKRFPGNMSELSIYATGYADSPRLYICPAGGNPWHNTSNVVQWTDYVYVMGLTEDDPSSCVHMFCPPEHHRGKGANVLYLDGSVYRITAEDFEHLTNTPSAFFGTSDPVILADLKRRTHLVTGRNFEIPPNNSIHGTREELARP